MEQFKLDLDDLQIESFDTTPESSQGKQGTVFGYSYDCDTRWGPSCRFCPTDVTCQGQNTCANTCANTCGNTCGNTCPNTCAYTCDDYTCNQAQNTCNGAYTCGGNTCNGTCFQNTCWDSCNPYDCY